jgi:hypothetical protein
MLVKIPNALIFEISTPLDSINLKVFLGFFYFFNLNLKILNWDW